MHLRLAAVLAGLLLAACSSSPDTARPPQRPMLSSPMDPADAPKEDEQPAGATSVPATSVPAELRFTAAALGGGTIEGADFAGHDLVMWFWAPW